MNFLLFSDFLEFFFHLFSILFAFNLIDPRIFKFCDPYSEKIKFLAMREAIDHFENFFSEVFLELAQFGEIEEMHVCDNIGDHLIGNTYVKFVSEDDAENVKKNISGRYYAGKLIIPEYSPVTGNTTIQFFLLIWLFL